MHRQELTYLERLARTPYFAESQQRKSLPRSRKVKVKKESLSQRLGSDSKLALVCAANV
jgi:hypothetical protein